MPVLEAESHYKNYVLSALMLLHPDYYEESNNFFKLPHEEYPLEHADSIIIADQLEYMILEIQHVTSSNELYTLIRSDKFQNSMEEVSLVYQSNEDAMSIRAGALEFLHDQFNLSYDKKNLPLFSAFDKYSKDIELLWVETLRETIQDIIDDREYNVSIDDLDYQTLDILNSTDIKDWDYTVYDNPIMPISAILSTTKDDNYNQIRNFAKLVVEQIDKIRSKTPDAGFEEILTSSADVSVLLNTLEEELFGLDIALRHDIETIKQLTKNICAPGSMCLSENPLDNWPAAVRRLNNQKRALKSWIKGEDNLVDVQNELFAKFVDEGGLDQEFDENLEDIEDDDEFFADPEYLNYNAFSELVKNESWQKFFDEVIYVDSSIRMPFELVPGNETIDFEDILAGMDYVDKVTKYHTERADEVDTSFDFIFSDGDEDDDEDSYYFDQDEWEEMDLDIKSLSTDMVYSTYHLNDFSQLNNGNFKGINLIPLLKDALDAMEKAIENHMPDVNLEQQMGFAFHFIEDMLPLDSDSPSLGRSGDDLDL